MLVIHDRMHGIVQGLLPLLDRIDEPFGRIDLLLDEEHGLFLAFVFLAAAVIFLQHFLIPFTDPQIGCILGIQRQIELATGVGNEKVGNDIALRLIDLADIAAGFGVQLDDLVDHVLQLIVSQVEPPLDLIVMLLSELVEVIGEYVDSTIHILATVLLAVQLDEQAFLQVAGRDTRRVELLDLLDQRLYFLFGGLDVLTESQVIGDGSGLPSQVAVIVDAADDLLGDPAGAVIYHQHAQLIEEHLVKRGLYFMRHDPVLIRIGIVVIPQLVIGDVVVIFVDIFADIDIFIFVLTSILLFIFFRVLEFVFYFLTRPVFVILRHFQRRVLLQLLLDPLFQVSRRHLQQLHKLNLLRGQFLE